MTLHTVVAVQTAGSPAFETYVETFRLEYSSDCTIFNESGTNLVLNVNLFVMLNLNLMNTRIKTGSKM